MLEEEQMEKIKSIVSEYLEKKKDKRLYNSDYNELLLLFHCNQLDNREGSLPHAFLLTVRLPNICDIFDQLSGRRIRDNIKRNINKTIYIHADNILEIYYYLEKNVVNKSDV